MSTTENTRDFVTRVLAEMQSIEGIAAHPSCPGTVYSYMPLPVVEDESYDGIATYDIDTKTLRWNPSRAQAHRDEHGDARLSYSLEGAVIIAAVWQNSFIPVAERAA